MAAAESENVPNTDEQSSERSDEGNWDLFGEDHVFEFEDADERELVGTLESLNLTVPENDVNDSHASFLSVPREPAVAQSEQSPKAPKTKKCHKLVPPLRDEIDGKPQKRQRGAATQAKPKRNVPRKNQKEAWKLTQSALVAWYSGGFHRVEVPSGRERDTFGLKFLSPGWVAENIPEAPTLSAMPQGSFDDAVSALTAIKRALKMKRKFGSKRTNRAARTIRKKTAAKR